MLPIEALLVTKEPWEPIKSRLHSYAVAVLFIKNTKNRDLLKYSILHNVNYSTNIIYE